MDKNTFEVLKFYIKEQVENTDHLNWLQKKLCKWFKIPYEKRFLFTIIVEPYVPGNEPRINDVVIFNSMICEFVIERVSMLPDPQIRLRALQSLIEIKGLKKGFIVGHSFEQL